MRNSQKDFCFFKTRHGLQIRANWGAPTGGQYNQNKNIPFNS